MKNNIKRTPLYFTLAMVAATSFIAALAVAQNSDTKKSSAARVNKIDSFAVKQ